MCSARLRTILDYARIAIKLLTQSAEEMEEFNCVDATREITIEANRPIPVQGDGELIGNTPVTVMLVPRSLHIVCPAAKE